MNDPSLWLYKKATKTFDRGLAAGLVEREENSCSLRRTKEEQRKRGEVFLCLKEKERDRESAESH